MKKESREQKYKYNFVFMYAHEEWWEHLFGPEFRTHPQVRIYKHGFSSNNFVQRLFRLHHSYSVNSKINLPFKRLWFRKMYKQNFEANLPLCFVYMGGNKIRFDGGFTNYVRKKAPDNRQVVYHADLISKKCNYDYNIIKNKVDLAITYDRDEAEKYGINHFCEVSFSKQILPPEKVVFEQDVYFLGAAKERHACLVNVCKHLTDAGIKCRFLLAGVNPQERVKQEGIEYIDSISYRENLQNIIVSKCILEVCQTESSAMTLRTREALAYGRRLLTNRRSIEQDFFKDGQAVIFDNPEDIDTDLLKTDYDYKFFENNTDTNPLVWLDYIQNALDKTDNITNS